MEINAEVISDLKGLINILNDQKEGYASVAEATESIKLKAIFLKYAAQRTGYAIELKRHIVEHGGVSENEEGGSPRALNHTWIDLKQVLRSKKDTSILAAVEAGEKAALEKYGKVLGNYAVHTDHIVLLQRQRTGILDALREIETYQHRLGISS